MLCQFFLVQHFRLPAQGWEEDANHPSEVVHEAYEVVFAPMVFVRKVGAEHFPLFILLPLSLRVQPAFPLSWSQALQAECYSDRPAFPGSKHCNRTDGSALPK